MFKQTGSQHVSPLTPQFVRYFSALPTYGGDRDREGIRGKRHVAWLRNRIEDGSFYTPVWSTARGTWNHQLYRVDGGHSGLLLSSLNANGDWGELSWPCDAFIREFTCEAERDLANLFDMFDHRITVRTAFDKVKAHRAVETSLANVSPTKIGEALRGIATCMSGCGEEVPIDEDARVRLVHEHQSFILWVSPFLGRRHLVRSGVMGAMFATYEVDRDGANIFWQLVSDESHENVHNATRILATFLRDSYAAQQRRVKTSWGTRGIYTKCIHAWNAWLRNETTELKYHSRSPLPKPRRRRNGT